MTYEVALKEAGQIGASECDGLPLLAMTCATLSRVHAINPKLTYEGARKKGLDAGQVRRLKPVALGDLMFA